MFDSEWYDEEEYLLNIWEWVARCPWLIRINQPLSMNDFFWRIEEEKKVKEEIMKDNLLTWLAAAAG